MVIRLVEVKKKVNVVKMNIIYCILGEQNSISNICKEHDNQYTYYKNKRVPYNIEYGYNKIKKTIFTIFYCIYKFICTANFTVQIINTQVHKQIPYHTNKFLQRYNFFLN